MEIDNTKLRIAMLGHKRIPSREGGVEVVVEELSTRLVGLGHQVTCFNRKGHHISGRAFDTVEQKVYKGITLRRVATINQRGLAAMTSSFFATLHAAFGKYDVVHVHAEGPAFMCWLPKLTGKRVIVTVHGLDHQRAKWGRLASTYIMQGEKNAVRFADEIIVLSNRVQRYFRETYGRETRYIPNGVNQPYKRAPEIIRDQFGLEKDSYILYLSRLVPEKGPQYLISAFKQVNTDKKLVIAGGSSDTDAFAQQLRDIASDDERILFAGFVQGQLLEELYSSAYIYVLPSDLEGMPLSLLEAMSYGNCCLTSDIPECTEVVEDRAVTFRRGQMDSLRDQLQQLVNNPQTVAGYQRTASQFICQKYSWDEVTERTLKLYNGA